jgi:hypothetical protein
MNHLLLRVFDVFVYKGRPAIVLAPSMDESAATRKFSNSLIDCAEVNKDGSLGKRFVLDREKYLREDVVKPIDNTRVTIHVELPGDITEQIKNYDEQEKTKSNNQEDTNEYHPSYGNIQLHKHTGNTRLFMSPFRHQNYICISIGRARKQWHLSRDRMLSDLRSVVEVYMSEAQFARFITSPMDGNGTPCTIHNISGTYMSEPPAGDEIERFHDDIEKSATEAAEEITKALQFAESLLTQSSVSKQDRKSLVAYIRAAQMKIIDSMPFTVHQMRARMEMVVADAQTEIEAHINNVITNTGLKAIAEQGAPITLALGAPKEED